jgi:hypothetical protein
MDGWTDGVGSSEVQSFKDVAEIRMSHLAFRMNKTCDKLYHSK